MNRDELLAHLKELLPSQFEEVLFRARLPPEYLSAGSAPLATRAIEVIRYLEQQDRLAELDRAIASINQTANQTADQTADQTAADSEKSQLKARRSRVLAPLVVSAFTGVTVASLLVLMLGSGDALVRAGLTGHRWVLLWLLLGLCAAVLVRSLVTSYARYRGHALGGALMLGGPVVVLVMVVVLGFALVPAPVPLRDVCVETNPLRCRSQELLHGALRMPEPEVRVLACDAVGEVRDKPSLPALATMVASDPDGEVRGHAAGALGHIGPDPATLVGLAQLEPNAPLPLRVWFAEARARAHDADASKQLAVYAGASDPAVAFKATLAYADLAAPGDDTAIALLKTLLERRGEIDRVVPHGRLALQARLGKLRPAARAALVTALRSSDESARLVAADGLARLGDDAGRSVAIDALASPSALNQVIAANILIALGDARGRAILRDRLADADPDVRRCAAYGLGLLGGGDSVAQLAERLDDPSWPVRIAAAAALMVTAGLDPKLLARSSIDWMTSALDSKDQAVRRRAADLIGLLPDAASLPLLSRTLADPTPAVRQVAARRARKIRAPGATQTLIAAVSHETDAATRAELVRALGDRRDPIARAALTPIAGEHSRVGLLAAGALYRLGELQFAAQIDDASDPARTTAADLRVAAMEAAADAHLGRVLRAGILDPAIEVRRSAAESMASLGQRSDDAIDVLRATATSRDAEIEQRSRALVGLIRLHVTLDGLDLPQRDDLLADRDPRMRLAGLTIVAALAAPVAIPLLHLTLFDPVADVQRETLEILESLAGEAADGVAWLERLALRDGDDYMVARAGAVLAGLLAAPAERATVSVRTAHDDAAAIRRAAIRRAEQLAQAVAGPDRDDAARRTVSDLVAACDETIDAATAVGERATRALADAEQAIHAAGGATHDGLGEVQAIAAETQTWLGDARARASTARQSGQAFLEHDARDAPSVLTLAETEIATGNLAAANQHLDDATHILRARPHDARTAYYYGLLADKQAEQQTEPAMRRKLLQLARTYFDEVGGTGPHRAVARRRSAQLAAELDRH